MLDKDGGQEIEAIRPTLAEMHPTELRTAMNRKDIAPRPAFCAMVD